MTFPIAVTADYASHVEARDHTGVVASLRPSSSSTVAVFGRLAARNDRGELFRNIIEGEYAGSAYPINRNGEPVAVSAVCLHLGDPGSGGSRRVRLPAVAVLEAVQSPWTRRQRPSA
jgi:hypothetical protein